MQRGGLQRDFTVGGEVEIAVGHDARGGTMSRERFCLSGLCSALILLGGCASIPGIHEVQAPYDSYICYNVSFSECLQRPELSTANVLRRRIYSGVFAGNTVTVRDSSAGTVTRSKDGKYQCNNGKIPYTQTLPQTERATVVFVAPSLLDQIGEQMVKLQRLRTICLRALAGYDFQLAILASQDQQAAAQKAVQYLSAKAEYENITLNTTVNTNVTLTPLEVTQFGLPPLNPSGQPWDVADALKAQRNLVTQLSEQLRNSTETQTLNVDYKQQFEDARLAIDIQLREVANELLALDSAAVTTSDDVVKRYYENGAWVQKGSTVLSKEK